MMMKVTNHRFGTSVSLIWILLECHCLSGNIFGFSSLFHVLLRYGIYQSRCDVLFEQLISNGTMRVTRDCPAQIDEYELAFALGIGFYQLPAVVLGMIEHFFGAATLKIIGIICHLISWLSLARLTPGSDYLILSHTVFSSLSGMCTLLSSFSLLHHFTQHQGFITASITGAQISSSIWYTIFQILIDQRWLNLSTLSWIWMSLAIMMSASALFCHGCAEICTDRRTEQQNDDNPSTQDSLAKHLTSPLFVLLTLFFSCLLLTVSYLPLVWFSWLTHLTHNNERFVNLLTIVFNLSTIFGLFVAPVCGYMMEYQSYRGLTQKIFNLCLLQTFTWLLALLLCFLCMVQSLITALAAMTVLILCRTMLVSSCQAVIVMMFPLRYVSTLLGIMWTIAGMVSFVCYGLTRFAVDPLNAWRAWFVIFGLCLSLCAYLIYMWIFYFEWKRQHQKQVSINEEEMKCLK